MFNLTLPTFDLANTELLLIVGRAVFLVFSFILAAVTFTAWRRATRRQTEQVLAQSALILEKLAEIRTAAAASDQSLARLAERLERIEHPSHTPATGASPGYQIALRLARAGASTEELTSGCGLTRAEAELVRRLHGPSRPELRQVS